MYFSCFCKKRYQKKQTSVPLDRLIAFHKAIAINHLLPAAGIADTHYD